MRTALSMAIARRALLAATLLTLGAAAASHAYGPAEIDAAAPSKSGPMRATVARLASQALRGRDNDTPQSVQAQRSLIARLKKLGSGIGSAQPKDDAYRQAFSHLGQNGTNLLALIPGRELPNEYVIVGGHYDHLDSRSDANGHCRANGAPGGKVCNGATDNATGAALVIELGRAIRRLPTPPRRSVILALWDSEEDGLVGSNYYVSHPIVPLAQTVGYINFDIQGAVLVPSIADYTFAVGAETGGAALQSLVTASAAGPPNALREFSHIFGQARSDYVNFTNAGVPTVFFSDSTGPCYHTTGDDLSVVSFPKLLRQAQTAFRVLVELAETATPLAFVPVPPLPGAVTFADALTLQEVVHRGIADLALFSPSDQTAYAAADAQLTAIVAAGPGAFSGHEVDVLTSAVQLINGLARIECRKR